ncbi:MAG: 4Fe-4S binding protein [Candidatus Moduliflexus flocculans]|nr:4Fe-4S binding protein [Candidatus Moduliflexus flocculans]
MGCASRAGKLDQHSVTHPRVNAKQCRNCSVCMAFCPEAAIVQAEGHVVIDQAKCIGCGECLVACKYGAIKMKWDEDSLRLQEKMAEYALRVLEHFKGKAVFVNFLTRVTKDCDCMAKNPKPIVRGHRHPGLPRPRRRRPGHGRSPRRRGGGKDPLRAGYDIDWSAQLAHGERIGLGKRDYVLVETV